MKILLMVAALGFCFPAMARADWSEDYGFWAAEQLRKHQSEQRFYNELERDRQWRQRNSEVLPGRQAPVDCYTYYVGNVSYESCY